MFWTGKYTAACAMALASAVLLAACQGDDTSSDLPSASASPTESANAEVVATLEAFWAERVRVETSGQYDTADFGGILSSRMIEPQLQQYKQYAQIGFNRVGEPELRDFTADVNGDTAIATVCVQEDGWGAEADIKIVEPEPQGWYANSHELKRADGAWLIVDTAQPPADITC